MLALPIGLSSSSSTMHTSSIRRTCSSSYPSRSPPSRADGRGAVGRTSRAREVSTSGKSVRTFSAVTLGAVVVTVALILAVDGSTWMLEMREILEIDGNTRGADMIIEGPQQDGDHARQLHGVLMYPVHRGGPRSCSGAVMRGRKSSAPQREKGLTKPPRT
mgnify:CR=1 FL=1